MTGGAGSHKLPGMKRTAPASLKVVARTLGDNGFDARLHYNKENEPGIFIPARGRYEVVAESDRAYYWRNEATKLSEPFTCDIHMAECGDEMADHLIHLLEDE